MTVIPILQHRELGVSDVQRSKVSLLASGGNKRDRNPSLPTPNCLPFAAHCVAQ